MRTDYYFQLIWMTLFLGLVLGATVAACTPETKTALDIVRGPAIDVLTKVIADRFGSGLEEATAYCEELPRGFRSGIEELDDNERGAFVMCWGEAGE